MKKYQSSIDWIALACDTDKESTRFRMIETINDGTTLTAFDGVRVHRATRSDRYPFADGVWSLATGELARSSDKDGKQSPYVYPDTSTVLKKSGDGYELFASDARALIVGAEAAAKTKTIPCLALLPSSDGGVASVNARYLAEALAGAFRGEGIFAPVTYWLPTPLSALVLEIDWSQGDIGETRMAAVMPVRDAADQPKITVDLASYVNVRQPVLV